MLAMNDPSWSCTSFWKDDHDSNWAGVKPSSTAAKRSDEASTNLSTFSCQTGLLRNWCAASRIHSSGASALGGRPTNDSSTGASTLTPPPIGEGGRRELPASGRGVYGG